MFNQDLPRPNIEAEIQISANTPLEFMALLAKTQSEIFEAMLLNENRYWVDFAEGDNTGVDLSLKLNGKGGAHV
jgi:hypothetical protein